ncbi:MAG: CBS domain-containing protein [Acidobacteria bacterium]|nr:CBS domain-containing protein [Acidobacteriota bacterium]
MGDHIVAAVAGEPEARIFMKALLADLTALERMIDAGGIESGPARIGAEQEMFLVDRDLHPAAIAPEILANIGDGRFAPEIGRFNLEANLTPRLFEGACLRELERETEELVNKARTAAERYSADVLLTGILPTIRPSDLTLDNLSPGPRYAALNSMLNRLRGDAFQVHIKGIDELQFSHDNVMLEACCNSFQVHLQVDPERFASLYNLAQAIAAPIVAVAANSPILLGQRLWHESRIPLFQHSVDERSAVRQRRQQPPRVSFGDKWIEHSALEIFREEIARYRVILTKLIDEDPVDAVSRGECPQLAALRLHNGTVWRWNRPCYGVSDGRAHLRIEARALPAGPTVLDEIANAALFLGLMSALPDEYGDIRTRMAFDDAKSNFFAAGRYGLKTQMAWIDGRDTSASTLLLDHLLPLARQGLRVRGIPDDDIERYIGTIERRVARDQTGALWALRSWAGLPEGMTRQQCSRTITAAAAANSRSGAPVHEWEPAVVDDASDWRIYYRTVGQIMSTDLFTVGPDDPIDLAAAVMEWKHIRHVPVEDDEGRLLGLLSHRDLLRLLIRSEGRNQADSAVVRKIMTPDPVTVAPETETIDAIELMRRRRIGCLPVVENRRLVGIVTAQDFLRLSAELITEQLSRTGSLSTLDAKPG